ncbi:MAG: hypothetical protein AB7O88_03215 [Reyranellaceae bacterium]
MALLPEPLHAVAMSGDGDVGVPAMSSATRDKAPKMRSSASLDARAMRRWGMMVP